ncbi:MAG: alcohol dehydrogenase catalytic domain-containing protein [Acidimicrobiia bacterium]
MTKPEFNTVVTVPETRTVVLDKRPYPNVRPGSVLVKSEIVALCVDDRMYTDHIHEWFDSPLSGLGHEGVGTVLEAPESNTFKPGDRVLISHGFACGRCFACQNGLSQAHCAGPTGGVRAGLSTANVEFLVDGLAPVERRNESASGWAALGEYRLAEEGICTLLPDDLDFRYAIAAECSVGMSYCAQEFMEVQAGERILLVGGGQRQFSLSHVIVGLFRGARVIAAVDDNFQRETVRKIGEARGGTPDLHIVDMRESSWTDEVFELTDGIGPDKVADFTSQEDILNTAIDLVRHDGVLYVQENLRNTNRVLKIDPYASMAEKNLRIMGTIDSRRYDRPGIIRMLRNKEVQRMWDVVATHEFPMSQVEEALKVSATQQCGKVLVYPHGWE